jgi:hypothetical protein
LCKQPALALSHFIIGKLHMPRRSVFAYAVHIGTAFLLSGIGHIISIAPISKGYISMAEVCWGSLVFFMAQAGAIIMESLVLSWWGRLSMGPRKENDKVAHEDVASRKYSISSIFGYGWVLIWLIFSGWWFVRLYAKLGVMEWTVPIRIVQPLLKLFANFEQDARYQTDFDWGYM